MSKDNRETEKKLIDLFLNIKNTLENDPAIIDTIWYDSVTTLHDEISFWIDDIQRGKIKGEVTIDSGADVKQDVLDLKICLSTISGYHPDDYATQLLLTKAMKLIDKLNPITIKGE